MRASHQIGKVILAGAGPGDPELITMKALRYLKEADVVVTDRLVSEVLLKESKPSARIIWVGKQGGEDGSTPQEFINELLVELAHQHRLVVRLKGGDVSFFSNILEELGALVSNSIDYEIIPGVTAASGAAAYAGIPLTARGYSSAVRFLTYNGTSTWSKSKWNDLASTDDTLVFYMSVSTLYTLTENLMAYQVSGDKHVAVIEQATTPFQRVHIFPLSVDGEQLRLKSFKSPSLVIIGRVVGLHRDFGWMPGGSDDNYFKPVKEIVTKQIVNQ